VDYTAGQDLEIDTVYGNISVTSGAAAGKVEVVFHPFDYEGHDEKDLAVRHMNENLVLGADTKNGVQIKASRSGSPGNGLGASISVKLPPEFDGKITAHNGDGPLNEFDIDIGWVGKSTSVSVSTDSELGNCTVQGAATVTNTTANCGHQIKVLDVSDNVTASNKFTAHAGTDAVIVVRIASISATATGGSITSQDGAIDATFPATGTYAIQAFSPHAGVVHEGTLPTGCTKEEAAPGSKTITCGGATPLYKLTAGNDSLGEGDIHLSYK
jgi:hypothetical protein